MFGLFTPKCPIDTAEKTWAERRMLWFADRFGIDRLRRARVILPTPEFFPDSYDEDYAGARCCLDRICGYMDVNPRNITLDILPDELMPNAAGWYQMRAKGNVCIAESQLTDPTRLMATLAHEVAHEILLRGGHLTGDEPDHEQVTDLLPAFLGIGIFGANATIRDSSGWEGGVSWWSISHQGYLSSFVLGYALALFAFVRGESWPAWRKHLRPDARGTLEKGLRFLQKTGDSLCTAETAGALQPSPTVPYLLNELSHRSPTRRIAAIWDIVTNSRTDPQFVEPLTRCLAHADTSLRSEAVWALAAFGESGRTAAPQIVALLDDHEPHVRAGAARVLGILRPDPGWVVPELVRLMSDHVFQVAWEATEAIRTYGVHAETVLPKVFQRFEQAVANNDDLVTPIARALRAISLDPKRELRGHMGERDPELLRLALNELATSPTDPTDPRCTPPATRGAIPYPRPPR
jgi:hypothetical protein